MRRPFTRKRPQPRYRRGSPERVATRHNRFKAEIAAIEQDLPDSLTASGELVRHGQATYLRRLIMPWQIRVFGYYDLVGEFKFASQYYARALSQLELFAAEKNEEGEIVRTENADVIAALDRIKDPGGTGRAGLLSDYGRLMFLTGEALLFVSLNKETQVEQWEMLSTDELRLLDGNYTRFMAPTLPAMLFKPAPDDAYEPVDDKEAVAYRLHKRHPRFSSLSDSTSEGVLDLLEEIVLLTQVVRARLRSRLAAAGILFLDDRITTRPDEAAPDEDPFEDPFLEDLIEATTAAITDEGTASAIAPMIARVKVPDNMKLADMVYHLQIVDPLQIYPETGLRKEAIGRLAMSLDMPAEALLGFSDVNHWNAWIIDEGSYKAHIQPMANGLVEDLTSAYLSGYLKDVVQLPDWDRYLISYDPAKVINHPDRTADALKLHAVGAVGDEALRREGGFTEEDAPTREELARIIGMAVRDAALAWDMTPSVRGGTVETAPGELVKPGDPATPATGANEVQPGPPPSGPPSPGEDAISASAALQAAVLASQIEGAAQLALLRAREAAGSRLRTLVRARENGAGSRDDEALAMIEGHRNRDIAAVLGQARVRALIGGPKEAGLVGAAHELIVDALRVFGVEDPNVAEVIAETIERHAARTLYEERPAPLPPSFSDFVDGLLRAAKRV